jgi:hypothetical protein
MTASILPSLPGQIRRILGPRFHRHDLTAFIEWGASP